MWNTSSRVAPTLAHANSKNEIRFINRGMRKQRKINKKKLKIFTKY